MNKYKKLILCILLDGVGYLSYLLPGLGEILDIGWAPISGWIMTKLFKGKAGKVAGVVSFIEELLPGLDFVPTFTIMWIYTYVVKKDTSNIIEVK